MSVEDLKEIYKLRWDIEINFNTLKHRFNIENFTVTIKLTHQQDLYSPFLLYNIFCYTKNLLNMKLKIRFDEKYGEEYLNYDFEYKINQSNLIRNLIEDLPIIMFTRARRSNLFTECVKDSIKSKKNGGKT